MSVEAHPNINAAAFTSDLMGAFMDRLRGNAAKDQKKALAVLQPLLVDFVTELSENLDMEFSV